MNLYLGNDFNQSREPENPLKAEKQPLFHVKVKQRRTRLFNLVFQLFSALR